MQLFFIAALIAQSLISPLAFAKTCPAQKRIAVGAKELVISAKHLADVEDGTKESDKLKNSIANLLERVGNFEKALAASATCSDVVAQFSEVSEKFKTLETQLKTIYDLNYTRLYINEWADVDRAFRLTQRLLEFQIIESSGVIATQH